MNKSYSKWLTVDCPRCPCYKEGKCYWGSSIKKLSENVYIDGTEHKPRHCEYFGKPPYHDMDYWFKIEDPFRVSKKTKAKIEQGKLL